MKALQQFLRPEFINRVDAVITFNRLSEENFHGIARIMPVSYTHLDVYKRQI